MDVRGGCDVLLRGIGRGRSETRDAKVEVVGVIVRLTTSDRARNSADSAPLHATSGQGEPNIARFISLLRKASLACPLVNRC